LNDENNGADGLFWSFAAVNASSSSPVLSFQSGLPPAQGNANAQDANPPSPWSSVPDGQQVLVPDPAVIPEPETTMLLAGVLLLLPFRSTMRKKAGSSQ